MKDFLPKIYLARHGETEWSLSGQHTGLTDIPLTEHGERNARNLGGRLQGTHFVKVLTSPLQRARRTCELAGFGAHAEIDPDLVEWNYGEYDGKEWTTTPLPCCPKSRWSSSSNGSAGSCCIAGSITPTAACRNTCTPPAPGVPSHGLRRFIG